jgi:hypothetical protein
VIAARRLPASLFALLLAAPPAMAAGDAPPNPFIHRNVCPFECCTYRNWITNKATTLVDKPNGTTRVATVPVKTVVAAVTGDVYSMPTRRIAAHAYQYSPIKKGDEYYALHSAGEGFWSVWYRGKVYNVELLDEMGEGADHSSWWVKIRTKDGKTGWALNTGQFDNADACG